MARDRNRAKQRQAQRRAERLAASGGGDGAERSERARSNDVEPSELEERADLEVGAPPEDVGFSERTLAHGPPGPDTPDELDDDDDFTEDDIEAEDGSGAPTTAGPRGVRGGAESTETAGRGRVIAFLAACWADLKRVQWPDRKQLTQLTGVVLFFVLIVVVYLSRLDAIFSRLIQEIL